MEWEKRETPALAFQETRPVFGEACHMRLALSAFVDVGAVQPQVPVLAMGEGRKREGCDQRTHRRPSPCVLTWAVTLLC